MNKTFLSILISVFVLTNVQLSAQPRVIDKVVAVVGNQVILKSEIEEQYLQMQAQGLYSDENQKCEIFEQIGELAGKIHQKTFDTYGYLTATSIEDRNEFSLKKMQKGVELNPSELSILSDSFFGFAGK